MENGHMTNADSVLASVLPSKGMHNTVLVDIVDLGEEDRGYGPKPYIQLVWETQETKPSGYPFVVRRTYSLSFYEKSSLSKDLEGWLDRSLRDNEKTLTWLHSQKHKPGQIKIGHTEHNGRTFPAITKVQPAGEVKLRPSGTYKTKEQWEAWHRAQEGGVA
jgi:hypothetical protein